MKKNNFQAILLIAASLVIVSTQVQAQDKVSVYNEINDFSAKLEEKSPEAAAAFFNLQESLINEEGALSRKQKEFIALGIAVSQGCEYCIYAHTAGAMVNGATEEEIIEAASVALYMQGGPGMTYMKYVFNALEEIRARNEGMNSED